MHPPRHRHRHGQSTARTHAGGLPAVADRSGERVLACTRVPWEGLSSLDIHAFEPPDANAPEDGSWFGFFSAFADKAMLIAIPVTVLLVVLGGGVLVLVTRQRRMRPSEKPMTPPHT